MSIAGTLQFNGIYIKNSNLILDAGTIMNLDGDWTFQYYHNAPSYNNDVKLFYTSDNSIGVYVSTLDNKLYLYFNQISTVANIPLNILMSNVSKCYTFVKYNNDFIVYVDGNVACTLTNIFSTRIYSSIADYLCICPTDRGYINSCNFMCFWSIALSFNFIRDYYKYVYPNDSASLIFNIRGDVDYTSNNNIVERDLLTSSLVDVDVCANTGGTAQP